MKKLKRFICLILVLCTMPFTVPTYADSGISVYINNSKIAFEGQPEIINGRTMVPMRGIFSVLGFTVTWNNDLKVITAQKDSTTIQLTVNSNRAYVNTWEYILDEPAVIRNNRTLVPLRFVAETAQCNVSWNETQKAVYITTDYDINYADISYTDNSATSVKADPENSKQSVVEILTDFGQGSGVIVDNVGYIITNYHVVEDAKSITMLFNDGSIYTGEVLVAGYDIQRDLAMLKINKTDLPSISIRDSNAIKPGENVYSIGSPDGKLNTISYGTVVSSSKYIICTTAFIDHGSSGGALFDEAGNLIGITSYGDNVGDYMSIPANFISSIPTYANLTLSQWQTVEPTLEPPIDIQFSNMGNGEIGITWAPMYNADGYYIYVCDTQNGEYEQLYDYDYGAYLWTWAYPYSLGVTLFNNSGFYIKISCVKDGVESAKSDPVYIHM